MAMEKREMYGFNRIRLQDFGALHIQQGPEEALTVEADHDMDKIFTEVRDGVLVLRIGRDWMERLEVALQTSLTRPHLTYRVTIQKLMDLEIVGAAQVEVDQLSTPELSVHLLGASDVELRALTACRLDIALSGGGQIAAAGQVEEQSVHLSGVGRYAGQQLCSQRARVHLSGAGSVSVWVEQELDVSLSGVGSVEYRGQPKVVRRAGGLGSVHPIDQAADCWIPRPPRPHPFG